MSVIPFPHPDPIPEPYDPLESALLSVLNNAPADGEPVKCPACKGSGEVSRSVRVGRRHRVVGQQTGLCLTCLGSGNAPTE
ncbi:hypothetical protein [Streptomyces sp. YS-3]|uniref:hypothetical protein n=1 Tax=Streptomyces sp. YS-3 TaxID=3381352 RepID=UPI003862A540